jgi:hypothetical protein
VHILRYSANGIIAHSTFALLFIDNPQNTDIACSFPAYVVHPKKRKMEASLAGYSPSLLALSPTTSRMIALVFLFTTIWDILHMA